MAGETTTSGPSATGFGLGLIQFGGWEFNSGRFDQLHGSDWWKAVNGWMMLDIQEAFDILSIVGPERAWAEWRNWTTRGDDPGLAAWIAYATSVSGESSPAARQAALWTAHQRSLHNGIRAAGSLLYAEDAREQELINYVIRNVDLAALNRMSTSDGTMGPYLSQTYPDYGQVTDHALALVEARSVENLFACGGNIAAMMPGGCVSPDELENIGVFSTRW